MGPAFIYQITELNKKFGQRELLKNINLAFYPGAKIGLLGRNGAGKSTLLKTIVGVTPPASGRVTLSGRELAGEPPARIARQGVAYVPQGRGLFAGMTVAENMQLGRLKRMHSLAGQADAGVAWDEERVFTFFPRLKERWKTEADYLSGGEQQMVAVARALAGDTRLLLLDEPFEGLAPTVVEELFEAFDRLRHDISIVIVDHHLDLALALSDRTVALERGEVVHVGPSRALAEDLDLRRRVLWM